MGAHPRQCCRECQPCLGVLEIAEAHFHIKQPENLEECLRVMSRVDVISPNHEEAAGLLSVPKAKINGKDARKSIKTLLLDEFLSRASSNGTKSPVICIRSGALGSLIAQKKNETIWVEAYHTSKEADRVVDVNGAGKAWLGGFTAGLAKVHKDKQQQCNEEWPCWTIEELKGAAQMASVSASFIVEQQSLPILKHVEDGVEKWNGEEPINRLKTLQHRDEAAVIL
jgi:sugar/nucleoside kinase (ribokinase family)